MQSLKPGRGPSAMNAVGSVVGIVFGIFWTIVAFAITKDAPFPMVHVIFPLFGLIFIAVGVFNLIYSTYNAAGRNRLSTFDLTSSAEEPDPLNQKFGASTNDARSRQRVGSFCPYCGATITDEFTFCPKCGKKL